MRKRLLFMMATGMFWIGFFEVFRLIFVIYQWELVKDIGFGEVLKAMAHGLYHDASLTGYILTVSYTHLTLPTKRIV